MEGCELPVRLGSRLELLRVGGGGDAPIITKFNGFEGVRGLGEEKGTVGGSCGCEADLSWVLFHIADVIFVVLLGL